MAPPRPLVNPAGDGSNHHQGDGLPRWPDGVTETLPTYASLMLHFDPSVTTAAEVEAWARDIYAAATAATAAIDPGEADAPVVEVPVFYGGDAGPDLDATAEIAGLTTDEVRGEGGGDQEDQGVPGCRHPFKLCRAWAASE